MTETTEKQMIGALRQVRKRLHRPLVVGKSVQLPCATSAAIPMRSASVAAAGKAFKLLQK